MPKQFPITWRTSGQLSLALVITPWGKNKQRLGAGTQRTSKFGPFHFCLQIKFCSSYLSMYLTPRSPFLISFLPYHLSPRFPIFSFFLKVLVNIHFNQISALFLKSLHLSKKEIDHFVGSFRNAWAYPLGGSFGVVSLLSMFRTPLFHRIENLEWFAVLIISFPFTFPLYVLFPCSVTEGEEPDQRVRDGESTVYNIPTILDSIPGFFHETLSGWMQELIPSIH